MSKLNSISYYTDQNEIDLDLGPNLIFPISDLLVGVFHVNYIYKI